MNVLTRRELSSVPFLLFDFPGTESSLWNSVAVDELG